MHRFRFVRKPAALTAVAAVAQFVAAGVAYARIPDSNGVIHACYAKSGGSLRVIDVSVTNCSMSETALDWNVQGQQGPQGDEGPQGPQGAAGPAGREGPTSNVPIARRELHAVRSDRRRRLRFEQPGRPLPRLGRRGPALGPTATPGRTTRRR